MAHSQTIWELCVDHLDDDETLIFADGYDGALLGIARVAGVPIAVYDEAAVIRILCRRDRMSDDDAREFFEFNIAGTYLGEGTPIFIRRI